jgi:hypothetical protein
LKSADRIVTDLGACTPELRRGFTPKPFLRTPVRIAARSSTAAAIGGASERSIMNQTGRRSLATLRRYIREGSLFQENAVAKTGL